MEKSIVSQILELLHRLSAPAFMAWMKENEEVLIEQERTQIADAWRAGNKDVFEMQTESEHGELYYDERFGATSEP